MDYDFDAWHICVILVSPGGDTAIVSLLEQAGYQLMCLPEDNDVIRIWLGSKCEHNMDNLLGFLRENTSKDMSLAIGEPRAGIDGWRQTFREAQAAHQAILYKPQKLARCRDLILESAVMRDQWLTNALLETFLNPLDGRGDVGDDLRETLRAYFKAGRSTISAAAILGVARSTVERRLRSVEIKIGQTVDACGAQLHIALAVEELLVSSRGSRSDDRATVGRSVRGGESGPSR